MPPIRSAHTRYLARHEAIQTDATNAAFANCSIELRVFILILVKSTRRAPNPPQMENTESNASSMVDVDSPHVSSVKNDYAGKTETEMKRLEREAEDAEKKLKHKFDEASENAEKGYDRAKKSAAKNAKSAEKKAKAAGDDLRDNQDNPVVIGNAVIIGLGSALLGFGAYQKYTAGELNWKVAGTWAGVVGLFAVGDYYVSQYLFKNKYPKK